MGNKVTKPSAATGQKVSMSKVSNKLPNPKAISDVLKNNSGGSNPISPRDKNETSKSNAFVTKKSIVDTRIQNKKQKIVVKTKPKETKEKSEVDILQIVKVNNYDYDDYDMINNCIVKHFFMRILDKDARNEIIKEMTLCKVDKGQTIFKQGSIGNFFYIVKEGELQLYINDVFIKNLYEGDNFGELALLHGANRSGAVTAKVDCLLYCLERRNFRKIVEHIKQMNYEENKKFINSIGILTNIEPDSKSMLASNLIKEHHEAGKFIVKEGEIGNCLYIIKEGQVGCSTDGKCIRLLEKGDHFGEMSILLDSVRTMDVIAKTNCEVFCITVDTIKSVAGERYKDVLYLNFIKMAIGKSKFFNKINMKLIENAYECFSFQNYANNDKILKAGTAISAKIIVVIQGNIFNKKINQLVAKAGDILYEEQVAGLSRDVVSHDLVAEPDCLLAHALTENFIKYMGGSSSFKDIIKKSNCLDSIGKIPLFKNFPQSKLDTLSSIITVQKIENGKKIITQGEVNDKFYIIKSGKVDIYINSGYVRTLNVFESFGERALFFSEPRTATAQANGTVELYVLLSQDFNKILEDNLSDHLKNRLHLQDNSIELKDLDYIKDLGAGSFGTVCLVRSRKTKYEYAIKSMSRKQIDHEQLHGNIDLEKKILLQIDHPFIVKLVKTLKTDKHIYFLMEYVRGKELYEVIRDIGLLSKFQTQFFSGSIMQAVNYLHERKYIYRDIKPENVMVSINGFPKLIDFGTCKEIVERTITIIGTPHYMAPEIILGEGYSFQVDFWSIAVCMYEFYCGNCPFGEKAEDPMEVYLAIMNEDLKFPSFCKDKDFISLQKRMLSRSTNNRLCKFSQIKTDNWYKDFSWENLLSFNLDAPYIPKFTEKETKTNPVAFINYIKTIKDWLPSKNVSIDKSTQEKYDKWFKEF